MKKNYLLFVTIFLLVTCGLSAQDIGVEKYISFSVSGRIFKYPKECLQKFNSSFFNQLLDKKFAQEKDENGNILIFYSQEAFKEVDHFIHCGTILGNCRRKVIHDAAQYFDLEIMKRSSKKFFRKQKRINKKITLGKTHCIPIHKYIIFIKCPHCGRHFSSRQEENIAEKLIVHLIDEHEAELIPDCYNTFVRGHNAAYKILYRLPPKHDVITHPLETQEPVRFFYNLE